MNFLIFFCLVITPLLGSEKEISREIENHLILRDFLMAVEAAKKGQNQFPNSLMVQEAALKAFCRAGREEEALRTFQIWLKLAQCEPPRRIYEELGWGIIKNGSNSSSPLIRSVALLAAYFAQDVHALKMLEKGLTDSHAQVRLIAAEVAGKMQDEAMKHQVVKRMGKETDWEVRLALIRALGMMKIHTQKETLLEIIASSHATMEEKGAATESLLALLEKIPKGELEILARSERAALRALAAEIITYLQDEEGIELLKRLTHDERAEVRGQAALGLAILRVPPDAHFNMLIHDRSFAVQLAAAYGILLSGSREADKWIEEALLRANLDEARIAAAMLAASGAYGQNLAKIALKRVSDFYVKMNLSLAILDKEALDILFQGLTENQERWSRDQKGVFRPLVPSKERHHPFIPGWPETINKETRLELLSLLAVKEHPKALLAVRQFLKDKDWGVSGVTSALLLTEGDDGAEELVRALLKDPEENVRLQAALILSRWDKEEDTTDILIQNYVSLDREKKEIVLQTLGKIGSKKAMSFLISEMGSPYASMRLIASASLLRCLYE